MKRGIPVWAGCIAAVLLASCCFLLLYQKDNKYTAPGKQAEDGVLDLKEAELAAHPLRFLWRDWDYYPNQLLTPSRLAVAVGRTQLDIGTVNRFGGSSGSPHGCGSYALTLNLPRKTQEYTIALPEIFSAYRFYVNGKLTAQCGQPDPGHYQDRTDRRLVTMQAGGQTTLLLAVSDYSHYYSGLIYPPAFGIPQAVERWNGHRILMTGAFLTLTLTAAVLALYLGFRMKHENAVLFALICLSVVGSNSYLLLHTFRTLPVQPWYGIELVSGYLFSFFLILLHSRICRIPRRAALAASGTAAVFCLVCAAYSALSAWLTVEVIRVFSIAVAGFKLAVAAYLLGAAIYAFGRRTSFALPLLYGDLIYAMAYLWDRILPSFEPITFGWFSQWGACCVVAAVAAVLWNDWITAYRQSLTFAEENRQMQRQLTMQVEHYEQLQEKIQESRRIRHDFRQHLRVISSLAQENQNQELLSYVAGITEQNESTSFVQLAENTELNAILQYYYALAQKHGIAFSLRLDLPAHLGVPVVELGAVVGNLLENAVEACLRQPKEGRYIRMAGRLESDRLVLVVDNSFDGTLNRQDNRFLSRKHAGVGQGIESVRELVLRAGGTLRIHPEASVFQVDLSLPIRREASQPDSAKQG